MTNITIGGHCFKGVARDGVEMETKIAEVMELESEGIYTPRSIGKKVGLDVRTVKVVLAALLDEHFAQE